MIEFQKTPMKTLKALQNLLQMFEIMLIMIYAPLFVVQARHDKMIKTDSANIIYNEAESD